jgi:enamine deaminase RidA (YjgF/YER057c/UK114 family)
MGAEARLKELGIDLPPPPAATANYVPFVREGGLLFVAGQGPMAADGTIAYMGRVGTDVSEEDGYQAARMCAVNCLAQIKAALGSLDNVKRVVSLRGFVACADDFYDQPKIINGASDLMVEVFGDAGRHARTAIGTIALPFNIATEVDMIVAAKE